MCIKITWSFKSKTVVIFHCNVTFRVLKCKICWDIRTERPKQTFFLLGYIELNIAKDLYFDTFIFHVGFPSTLIWDFNFEGLTSEFDQKLIAKYLKLMTKKTLFRYLINFSSKDNFVNLKNELFIIYIRDGSNISTWWNSRIQRSI